MSCEKVFVVKTTPLESEVAMRRIEACTCVADIAIRMASATATGRWLRAIVRRVAHGNAWWPISVRWMRPGGWASTNKPQVLPLLHCGDSSGTLEGIPDAYGESGSGRVACGLIVHGFEVDAIEELLGPGFSLHLFELIENLTV